MTAYLKAQSGKKWMEKEEKGASHHFMLLKSLTGVKVYDGQLLLPLDFEQ